MNDCTYTGPKEPNRLRLEGYRVKSRLQRYQDAHDPARVERRRKEKEGRLKRRILKNEKVKSR